MGAKSAFGTKLKISDEGTPTPVFTEITGITNISGPSLGMETIDVTSHSSAGQFREVIPSFKTAGELTATLLYDSTNTQHAQLFEKYNSREKGDFELVLTDAGAQEFECSAYVSGFEFGAPIDDAVKVNLTLSIDGEFAEKA